jgi:hypothetical protein
MNFLMSGKTAATHAVARRGPRSFNAVHVTTEMHDEVLVVPGTHSPEAEGSIAKIVWRADPKAIQL